MPFGSVTDSGLTSDHTGLDSRSFRTATEYRICRLVLPSYRGVVGSCLKGPWSLSGRVGTTISPTTPMLGVSVLGPTSTFLPHDHWGVQGWVNPFPTPSTRTIPARPDPRLRGLVLVGVVGDESCTPSGEGFGVKGVNKSPLVLPECSDNTLTLFSSQLRKSCDDPSMPESSSTLRIGKCPSRWTDPPRKQ